MPSRTKIVNAGQVLVHCKSDDTFLILRSSEWLERPDRSLKPDIPGGESEQGEDFRDTAIRELREETGIEASDESLVVLYANSHYSPEHATALNHVLFRYDIETKPEVSLSSEHIELMWLTKEELLSLEDIRKPYPEIFSYLNRASLL